MFIRQLNEPLNEGRNHPWAHVPNPAPEYLRTSINFACGKMSAFHFYKSRLNGEAQFLFGGITIPESVQKTYRFGA